ncbi:hypothetical protein [Haloarcula sp. CGMCC 1.2071]|uniref:hypothetical protein n=1 Tax=Haloarcula sp. CGMCC 1.2071 TaxID=3111454 RepID=UPI00300F5BB0
MKDGYHSKKYNQIRERAREERPIRNPMLINRRSDSDFKEHVRKEYNSVVVDTDIIVGCQDTHPEINRISELFNLTGIIHLLPPLETESGEELDGEGFINAARRNDQAEIINPSSELAAAASTLPDQYLKRIRGGVHLHYVNTFYRSASDRTHRDASLLLQQIYNLLLREDGMTRQEVLDMGWEELIQGYRNIKSLQQRESDIRDQTRVYIAQLLEENVVAENSGKIYARKSRHPQTTFSF